ncbi:hypothetical protein OIU78_007454 [Salix suchowensis]|nr:hypothetical protein OIU78_007454 [Salix suchowensis]
MGGKSSKGSRRRDYSSYGSAASSSSWNHYEYPPASPYPYPPPSPQQSTYSTQQHHHAPAASNPSYSYESQMPPQQPHKRLDRKYSRIADNYQTLDQELGRDGCYMLVLHLQTSQNSPLLSSFRNWEGMDAICDCCPCSSWLRVF